MSADKKPKGFRSSADFVRGANENPPPAVISDEKGAIKSSSAERKEASHAYSLAPDYIDSGNPRIKVTFQVRMSEPLHLKLKHLADNLPNESMHSIVLNGIEEIVNRLILDMNKNSRRQ